MSSAQNNYNKFYFNSILGKHRKNGRRYGRHSVLADRLTPIKDIQKIEAQNLQPNSVTPKNRLPKLNKKQSTEAAQVQPRRHRYSGTKADILRQSQSHQMIPPSIHKKSLNPKELFTYRRYQPQIQSLQSPKFKSIQTPKSRKTPRKKPQFIILSLGLNTIVKAHNNARRTKTQQTQEVATRQKSGTIQYNQIKTYYENKYETRRD